MDFNLFWLSTRCKSHKNYYPLNDKCVVTSRFSALATHTHTPDSRWQAGKVSGTNSATKPVYINRTNGNALVFRQFSCNSASQPAIVIVVKCTEKGLSTRDAVYFPLFFFCSLKMLENKWTIFFIHFGERNFVSIFIFICLPVHPLVNCLTWWLSNKRHGFFPPRLKS